MIRQALPEDAPQIAPLILLAMGDLAFKFSGTKNLQATRNLFERFIALPGNQYSYTNILLYTDKSGVCGIADAYDGAQLDRLRAPFLAYVQQELGVSYTPGAETGAGEYYLDCIAVAPGQQGKGIGRKLIQAVLDKAANEGHDRVGLLVDRDNPDAKKLYAGTGFKVSAEQEFMGGKYFHMQMTTLR